MFPVTVFSCPVTRLLSIPFRTGIEKGRGEESLRAKQTEFSADEKDAIRGNRPRAKEHIMKINNDPTLSIGERLIQETAAERRSVEKALTQATSGEMGVGGDDTRAGDKAQRLAISMDNTRLSASAMARYRAFSGAKTADEQSKQTRDDESFSHKSYMISEASRAAEWKRRKEEVSGKKDEERTDEAAGVNSPREPQRKSDTRNSTSTMGKPAASESGGGDNQDDAATKVKDRIKEVQRMLTQAQGRLAQAAEKVSSAKNAGGSEDASGKTPPPDGATPPAGAADAAGGGQAELAAAQAEMAAAESEVNSLAGELMKLYQELMKTMKGQDG